MDTYEVFVPFLANNTLFHLIGNILVILVVFVFSKMIFSATFTAPWIETFPM
ncbi:hypothetical protein GQ44DRAFT_699470 [Phaeosphaeriaceae sp. PMI808]|nr:hypothetical protein GQ44DRAFT_699470 [Phaeosphaeriaceae sp. PMI808]